MALAASRMAIPDCIGLCDLCASVFQKSREEAKPKRRSVTVSSCREMVSVWLEREFEGGRHARRVEKVKQVEDEFEA